MAKILVKRSAAAKKPVTKSPVKQKAAKPEPKIKEYKLTGLSLKGLMRATPPLMKNNAREVIVKALKEVTTKGGFPAIRSKCLSVGMRGRRLVHSTDIIGKEKGLPLSKQKHVLVSCDCEDFCFTWEYALAHWGSAKIKYSNGEAAVVKNPQNHPGMCKHLVALTRTIFEHGL